MRGRQTPLLDKRTDFFSITIRVLGNKILLKGLRTAGYYFQRFYQQTEGKKGFNYLMLSSVNLDMLYYVGNYCP